MPDCGMQYYRASIARRRHTGSANLLFVDAIEELLLAVHVELGVGVLHVGFHRVLGKVEHAADGGFAAPAREQCHHLDFPFGEEMLSLESVKLGLQRVGRRSGGRVGGLGRVGSPRMSQGLGLLERAIFAVARHR